MAKKLGKMWQYTIMTVLVMACFTLMGGRLHTVAYNINCMDIIADFDRFKSKEEADSL